MIDIIDIPEAYRDLFRSADKNCRAEIKTLPEKSPEIFIQVISKYLDKYYTVLDEKPELREMLRKYLNQEVNCANKFPDTTGVFSDKVRNKTWWVDYKEKCPNKLNYWNRYSEYLVQYKNWDPVVIENGIDASTDIVMNAIANPQLQTNQDVRGLIFGHVQSGKTAHYIGLINKAIDAGYKIIIILAGIHNNLRSQTQTRIDEEVLGFESSLEAINKNRESELQLRDGNRIGVGLCSIRKSLLEFPFQACTSRDEKGDFNKKRAESLSMKPPLLAVIKKNKSSLESMKDYWMKKSPVDRCEDSNGKIIIDSKYPALIIDDEADQASPNTKYSFTRDGDLKDDQKNPSTTNGDIRSLLNIFACKTYVGYTATPYANIFIPPNVDGEDTGADLFPKDFIIKMPHSPKYFGANEFFGWKNDDDIEMPLYRPITRQLIIEEVKNQNLSAESDSNEFEFGEDLIKAIQMFFISTALRNIRGHHGKPNTMLIHTDRKIDDHSALFNEVIEYLQNLKNMITYNDSEVLENLKILWETDYIETTAVMKKYYANRLADLKETTWDDIKKELYRLSREQTDNEIKCKVIDGASKDFLDYKSHIDRKIPYNVIIIGGDKLSRGLTLEGLTVSFFTRNALNYDTLMQMGRWFGYRPGYLDLCRLFVTPEIYDRFRHISYATEDLIKQIDYMNDCQETPKTFGLHVLLHPASELMISSKNKIGCGEDRLLTFSNTPTQTTRISIDAKRYIENFAAVSWLCSVLGTPKSGDEYAAELKLENNELQGEHLFWTNVNGKFIADFFKKYSATTKGKDYKANSLCISQYIKDQLKFGGLTNWTVCLINIGAEKNLQIGSLPKIGNGIIRNMKEKNHALNKSEKIYTLKTLTSNNHEYLDYSKEQWEKMKELRKEKTDAGAKHVSSDYLREKIRDRTQGLLILYPLDYKRMTDLTYGLENEEIKTPFAVATIFPHNGNFGNTISYRVNKVGQMKEEDDEE